MALGAIVSEAAFGFVHGSFFAQLLIGALSAAGAGVLVGFALRRLDDTSFAIATLAFSAVMMELAQITSLHLGTHRNIMHIAFAPSAIECVLLLALCVGICKATANSWFAYGAGALAAGVAGVVLPSDVASDTTTLIVQLCMAVGVAVIGGRRSAFGPLLGGLLAGCALPLVHIAGRGGPIVTGVLLIASYIWLPEGLLGIAHRMYGSLKQRPADGAA